MNLNLDLAIRDKLASYLVGEISLAEFEDWFVPASWNVAQSNNQNAINLVYEIELWLAEYSDGHWREDELKQHFRSLVIDYKVDIGSDHIIIRDSIAKTEWYQLLSVPSYI